MDEAMLKKNPASLGLIKIKNIIYYMFMYENGEKLMKLYIGTLKIQDYRENTKLTKNKRIIFDYVDLQFNNQEQEDIQDLYEEDDTATNTNNNKKKSRLIEEKDIIHERIDSLDYKKEEIITLKENRTENKTENKPVQIQV